MKKLRNLVSNMKLNTKFTAVILITTIIPITVLALILFYNMQKNVIDENVTYMQYTMERNEDSILTNINSINMSTQFFLMDEGMVEWLNRVQRGELLTTQELVEFHDINVANLERLVNNNPLLYSVRVYANSDDVQEMMPILYKKSRMEKLAWAGEEESTGWHFDYNDTAFSSLITNQKESLAALVTPIVDYKNGTIGVIEASMTMETMFPALYDKIEAQWSCFVSADQKLHFGQTEDENSEWIIQQVLSQTQDKVDIDTYYTKIGGTNLVIGYLPIRELKGALICVKDMTNDMAQIRFFRNVFMALMIVVLIIMAFISNFIVNRMLRQFYIILQSIRKVQQGDLDVRIERFSNDEVGELGSQLNTMLDRIQKLMEDNVNREILAKDSQLKALQNQINAHFIYNVLESIKMMAEIDEEYTISDAITSLGKLLRYSMRWASGNVRVSEELEYIRDYLMLINLRYDFTISLSTKLNSEMLEQEIPKMSLQPIVENAVLHGIEPTLRDSTIYIKGWREENDCVIEITDGGKGMTEEELRVLRKKITDGVETTGGRGRGNGIGLKNVEDRIQMAFGKEYGLSVASKKDCYTKISVRLPYKKGSRGYVS